MRQQMFNLGHEEETPDNTSISKPVAESDVHLFRTVYFAAKENQPNSDVNKLLDLLKLSGVDVKYSDLHSETISDIQQSLLWVIDENMKSELESTKYYGLVVDESTDLSVHKKLVIYIRYVCPKSHNVKSKLIGDIRIQDGTAETIVMEIKNKLKGVGLETVNLVGLGSDGASVMFGKKGGVGVKLLEDCPAMTHIHCVAHRLALACVDAAKDVSYLKSYRNTLKNLYIHVNGSGVRTNKLEQMQSIMNEPHLKLKDPINIRWLAMEDAVQTVHKCYTSIVMYLQSNDGKNSVGDVVADGLLKDILHYRFPAFTAVLSDTLHVLGVLSKQLQSASLDLSEFLPLKESAIGRLNGLLSINGKYMDEFEKQLETNGSKVYYKGIQLTHANEKAGLEKMRKDYIQSVCENLEKRMSVNAPVLKAFSVLEPSTCETLCKSEVESCLEVLSKTYGVDPKELSLEYCGVSALLKGSYRNIEYKAFCKMIMKRHSVDFPLISKLCHISLCIPVSSVECERGFSLQNRIKVKFRTSLTPENLDTLMKLSSGPAVDQFPYEKAIRHWHRAKKRRLARLYAPANSSV